MVALSIPRMLTIAYTVAPARDAFRYWQAAYQLEHESPTVALASLQVSPVYPVCLMLLQWATKPFDPHDWLWINQVFNVTAYVVFIVLAYQVGSWVWSPGISFWGCLAVGLLPRQIAYSCDVLSDSLFAALWMFSFAAALWSLRHLSSEDHCDGRLRARQAMFAAGLLAALAYLTRVEGLLLPAVLFGTLALLSFRYPVVRMSGLGAAYAVPFVVIAGSYIYLTGNVSPRNSAQALFGGATIAENRRVEDRAVMIGGEVLSLKAEEATPEGRFADSVFALLKEMTQETRGWLLLLAVYGGVIWLCRSASSPLALPVGLALLGCVLMLILLHYKAGYLASRYLTPILPFVGMLGMIGLRDLWTRVTVDRRFSWERSWSLATLQFRRRLVFATSLALLITGLMLPRWLQPLHPHRAAHMKAAAWLRAHSDPADRVFDPLVLTSYFAVRHAWWPTAPLPTVFPCRFAVIDPTVLSWCDNLIEEAILRMSSTGQLVAKFPRDANADETGVFIFELPSMLAEDERRGAD